MNNANETTFSELKLWDWFIGGGMIGRKVSDNSYAWRKKNGIIVLGVGTQAWQVTPLPTCTGFDWRPPGDKQVANRVEVMRASLQIIATLCACDAGGNEPREKAIADIRKIALLALGMEE